MEATASVVEKPWMSNAPLRLRKLKELMTGRLSVDVTSLVATGPGQPALSAGFSLHAYASAWSWTSLAHACALAAPCRWIWLETTRSAVQSLASMHDITYLRDEFAALCIGAVELEKGPDNV